MLHSDVHLTDLIGADMTVTGATDVVISGLTADSRSVRDGMLFAALPGAQADGRAFVPQAIAAGAIAILAPEGSALTVPEGVTLVTSPQPRRAFARMAAFFHGRQPTTVVAVTGTNGKTSTAVFTEQLWTALGHKAASLGTLGVTGPVFHREGRLTTPDPVLLHEILAQAADAGVDHLCMEASSHGLDQHRLDGVRVTAAAFTNLTRDHLDYHGTVEAYAAAKRRLVSEVLAEGGTAVLNADVPEFSAFRDAALAAGRKVMSFGTQGADLRLVSRAAHPGGQRLTLDIQGQSFTVDLPLIGGFQAMNALAALGLALATGAEAAEAVPALERLRGVPGRMQAVATVDGASVVVDYAHTPDALRVALEALRPHVTGRLMVVFGCGGDRDRGKRPEMAAIAASLADHAIVTDDNPRSEDPAAIRAEVLAGAPGLEEIGDRHAAIAAAVAGLRSGDILLIAGKGHETGQIIGATTLPFDDREEARKAVQSRGGEVIQ